MRHLSEAYLYSQHSANAKMLIKWILRILSDVNTVVGKSRYCSYCYETISLVMVFLMMSKEEGFYVQESPSHIDVLGRMSTSGSEC